MKKVVVLVLSFGLIGSAMGQIAYPTNVFWQFLEGLQAGDSSTLNYLEYKNDFLLLKTDQRDDKVLQVRNELNDIGISTIFIDANGNGGFSIDSSGGQTVIKLRGALSDHSYINNEFVSIGRGGQSQDYGGNVDGAKFTVSSDTREPDYGLWDANNYQMMLQSAKDSLGGYVGLAFTSESAAQDRNVGAFINYRKTGNNGRGELHFGTKTATGSLADGVHAMKIYDGSVTIDSTIVLPNLATGTSDTVLILDGDVVQKKDISSFADNIYNTDGTLTGNRTLNLDTYDLTFNGGDVGIGTTSPIVGLDVRGTAIITNQAGTEYNENLRLPEAISGFASMTLGGSIAASGTSGTSQWTILKYPTSNLFSIRNNHTDRLNITTGGNVGIATTTPSSRLQVKGNGSTSATTAFLVENSNASPSLSVLDNGNVGIGTTSPADQLSISNSAGTSISITTGGAAGSSASPKFTDINFRGYFNTPMARIRSWDESSSTADGYLTFWTNNFDGVNNLTEKMRITPTGNVGIGTTTPSAKIHADNTATTGVGAIIENSNVTNTDDLIQFHNSTGEVASVTNEGYLNIKAATGTSDTVLIIDNDVVQKKVLKDKTIFGWNGFADITASATRWTRLSDNAYVSTETQALTRFPSNGTFKKLVIGTGSTQSATGDLDIYLTINSVQTALAINVPAGTGSSTFTVEVDVPVTALDDVKYEVINSATANSARIASMYLVFEFD